MLFGLRFQEMKLRDDPIHETEASRNECIAEYTVLGAALTAFVIVNRTNNEKYKLTVCYSSDIIKSNKARGKRANKQISLAK